MPGLSRFQLVALAAALLLGGLAVTGCGTAAAPKPGPRVTLVLTAPAQGHRTAQASATIRGRVTPHRAQVRVLGQRVKVSRSGAFSTQVGLAVGTNLIDVEASVPRSSGAATAVSVVRFLLVTVPQLVGDSPSQATSALRDLGLTVKTDGSSDPLNFLIPGSNEVCSETPGAGVRVDPGSTVTIKISKVCF